MITNSMLRIVLFLIPLMPNLAYAKSGAGIFGLAILVYVFCYAGSITFVIQLVISGIAAIFATPGIKRKIFFKTLVIFWLVWLILCAIVAAGWLPLYMLVMIMIISAMILWCTVVFSRVKKENLTQAE